MNLPFHVYPISDTKPHETEMPVCDCNPEVETVNGSLIVTHNAWDGREWKEMAQVKNGKPPGWMIE